MSEQQDGDDLASLLSEMQNLQARLAGNNEVAVEGSAGGGLVRVGAIGEFSFTTVKIDPSVVDANALSELEDLVLAAVRDAATKLVAARNDRVGRALTETLGGLLAPPSLDDGAV